MQPEDRPYPNYGENGVNDETYALRLRHRLYRALFIPRIDEVRVDYAAFQPIPRESWHKALDERLDEFGIEKEGTP